MPMLMSYGLCCRGRTYNLLSGYRYLRSTLLTPADKSFQDATSTFQATSAPDAQHFIFITKRSTTLRSIITICVAGA